MTGSHNRVELPVTLNHRIKTLGLCLASVFIGTTNLSAEPISTQEEFKAIIQKDFLDKGFKSYVYIRTPLTTDFLPTGWKCTPDLLHRVAGLYQALYNIGAIRVDGPLEQTEVGFLKSYCEFTVTHIDRGKIGGDLVEISDTLLAIKLVNQELLGFNSFERGRRTDEHTCGMFANVLIENTELTEFAKKYKSEIKKSWPYEKIYQDTVEGQFCGTPLENGNMKWLEVNRLRR
ncbi:hypothetical protein WNZ14_09315 [Hoeflea sp. AS60]|uniref:hypothetical protein n=1 Tax=Hoeflea sp. AS60 TaxID=3135780 RepID=UPI00316DB918